MASILRQIVAGPRLQHPEANLDLCYVADNIIATSGPSSNYPQRAYRNPLDELVSFLDAKHGDAWAIWEFRAEGTGYPDEEVYGRVHHFPWPDHHPPPFALIPPMMGSMRNWLWNLDGAKDAVVSENDNGEDKAEEKQDKKKRVAVVHCKAGKGRSGTVACSYLISEEGWSADDALQRFTERRMRQGFGAGVSIPSQLRWVRYVDRWVNQMAKRYIERPVEILEVHVWGLRDGVKAAVEGFVDEGKTIKCFHLFHRNERTVIDSGKKTPPRKTGANNDLAQSSPLQDIKPAATNNAPSALNNSSLNRADSLSPRRLSAVIFRPSKPVILPTSDVNIDFERRSKAAYTGWAMVTSIAHVWFNAFFEGGDTHDSGVFEADWDTLDGIKGTTKKGVRALERVKVVWRYPPSSQLDTETAQPPHKDSNEDEAANAPVEGTAIPMPKPGEPVPESHPGDWHLHEEDEEEESRERRILRDQENLPAKRHTAPPDTSGEVTTDRETDTDTDNDSKARPKANANAKAPESSVVSGITNAATAAAQSISGLGKELGLRQQTAESQDVSLAESDDNTPSLGRRKHKGKEMAKKANQGWFQQSGDAEAEGKQKEEEEEKRDGKDGAEGEKEKEKEKEKKKKEDEHKESSPTSAGQK